MYKGTHAISLHLDNTDFETVKQLAEEAHLPIAVYVRMLVKKQLELEKRDTR